MIQPLFFRSFRVVSDFFLRRFEKQIEQNENKRKKIKQIRTDNTKTKGRIMIQPFLFRLIRFVSEILLRFFEKQLEKNENNRKKNVKTRKNMASHDSTIFACVFFRIVFDVFRFFRCSSETRFPKV